MYTSIINSITQILTLIFKYLIMIQDQLFDQDKMLMKEVKKKVYHQMVGPRISLRQYKKSYIHDYLKWFSDHPQLLELTASEPLTLEQEIVNHNSWLTDPKKYIFIIFNQQQQMIGDLNLFFSSWIEPYQVEINIMIADKSQRGKGYAKQVISYAEWYVLLIHNIIEMIAKIKEDNISSIRLFQSLGYKLINHSSHFKEFQYAKTLTHKFKEEDFTLSQVQDINTLYQ